MSEDFNGISSHGWSQIAWYKRESLIIRLFQKWISLMKDVLFTSRDMVRLNALKSSILKKSLNSGLLICFPWIRNAARNLENSHGRLINFIAVSNCFWNWTLSGKKKSVSIQPYSPLNSLIPGIWKSTSDERYDLVWVENVNTSSLCCAIYRESSLLLLLWNY